MLTSVSFSAFMDENTEKAQQQREEIPYPVTNERRLGVDNQWMTNVGSMNPILSTRRKSLQLFWANFPSDQHNVTFPFVPSFCNLWPSNQTLGSFFLAVFCGWMVKGAAACEEKAVLSFFLSSPSFHFHFTLFVFVALFNAHPVGMSGCYHHPSNPHSLPTLVFVSLLSNAQLKPHWTV